MKILHLTFKDFMAIGVLVHSVEEGIETCVCNPESVWIRLNGKVTFSKDMNIKSKIISENPLVKSIYESLENPTFEIFYFEEAKAVIANLSGNPPREYSL